MSEWVIGRQYCPKCGTVRTVVRHPEVAELCCPTCGTVTSEARGPDDLHPMVVSARI